MIGLTGTIASGKEAAASLLVAAGFTYFSLSDRVREEASRRGVVAASREELQRIGNELRASVGPSIWAARTFERIVAAGVTEAVVDGFRNPQEVTYFRERVGFYLVAVDAPTDLRFRRLRERQRQGDPETRAEFLRLDARDHGVGETEGGQQVGACLKLAQFTLWNDGSLEDLQRELSAVLAEVRHVQR